jgi:hypothetical protein
MIDLLNELRHHIRDFDKNLRQLRSSRVKKGSIIEAGRRIVDFYFRSTREVLSRNGIQDEIVTSCDTLMHRLLETTHKISTVSAYKKLIKELNAELLTIEKSVLLGVSAPVVLVLDQTDQKILETLKQLLPSAALSYEQAILDLQLNQRLSWRGPATDLREALREILDYLAPDKEVMNQHGFNLEQNTTGPTMKQKVRYILGRRGISKSIMQTPESAAEAVDTAVGTFVRSVYTRSNLSTHTPTQKSEVLRVRDWVRIALCELLEIH